ncbi:MAG: glycerophosphodiester phosphodiesterase [Anaerolineae bacterium]|nr:glycerophosphodiester phosphodiesterase [Anaerolineae bacterium]
MFRTFAEGLAAGRALTFGHRGARAYAPMNTLPSFEMALHMGAHGIEFDVRQTRDGDLVILHDPTIDGTSNGHGAAGEMTFAELREFDFGGWFHAEYAGTAIPTLDEVFEAFGQRFLMNVEIKSEHLSGGGIEARVAEVIARHHLEDRVLVSSFNLLTVWRFGRIMPHVLRGMLVEGVTPFEHGRLLKALDVRALHPYYPFVDAEYMQKARALGLAVNTWTVNDPAEAQRLAELGVSAVITDRPDTILAALGA